MTNAGKTNYGAVACGHSFTASSAESILRAGGNAFDAIVAAHFAACVAEPVLASLAGGGYLLVKPHNQQPVVYDFFAHTPQQKRSPDDLEFYPISADFGRDQQEFHIGAGSIATPGSIRGMYDAHKDLCSMPMADLIAPALEGARKGVKVNNFHAYFLQIVSPIFTATEASRKTYGSPSNPQSLALEGDLLKQPELADTLEALATEGEGLFYRGELAERLAQFCRDQGGLLTRKDLEDYKVVKRPPMQTRYRNATLLTNPPPSSGGILISFALQLLTKLKPNPGLNALEFGSESYVDLMARVMEATNKARIDAHLEDTGTICEISLLDKARLESYRQHITKRPLCSRGTTHISVMDADNNVASLTLSNGEGCGHLLPGTGIMLNNILGEEDLNPHGFHQWPCNERMTSMMAPSILSTDTGGLVALGSGGSNRIRTAILQVIMNLVHFDLPLQDAVAAPRIHFENGLLSLEQGYDESGMNNQGLAQLAEYYPNRKHWDSLNVFFGGVHSVARNKNGFQASGDPRRGGVGVVVT